MTGVRPAILERKIVPKVWGGTALRDVLGIELPAGTAVGETWELYDRPDGSSPLRDCGATLAEWLQTAEHDVLGAGVAPAREGRFPILIKYVDAREALSVQVHPDRELAERDGDGPKSEAWVVLAAGASARIIRGFRAGVSRDQVDDAVDRPELEGLVFQFAPRVGDAIDVPPGMVHSIGPDVVLFEVQQNSDLTYRLYDWGRDSRELHVERALEAIVMHPAEPATLPPTSIDENSDWVIRTEHFRVRRFRVTVPCSLATEGSFKVLSIIRGQGTLGWRSGGDHPPLIMRTGDTALVPACVDCVFLSPVGAFEVLCTDAGEGR